MAGFQEDESNRLTQYNIAPWFNESFTNKTGDDPNASASAWNIILLKEDIDFELDNASERDFDVKSSIGNITIGANYSRMEQVQFAEDSL